MGAYGIGSYNFNPSNDPAVWMDLSYDAYRNGDTVDYYLDIYIRGVGGQSCYGYNITCNIAFNWGWVISGYEIKSTVSQWDGYNNRFHLGTVGVGITPNTECRVQMIDPPGGKGNGFDTGDIYLGGPSASAPGMPEWGVTVNSSMSDQGFEPGAHYNLAWGGGGGLGNYATSYHVVLQEANYQTGQWVTIWDQPAFNCDNVALPSRLSRGQYTQYRVLVYNNYGLNSPDWKYSPLVYCNNAPSPPGSLTAPSSVYISSPMAQLNWTAGAAGAGSISYYEVQVRNVTKNSDWVRAGITSDLSMLVNLANVNGLTINAQDVVAFQIRTYNSNNVWSDFRAANQNTTVLGGILRMKIDGAWKTGIVYLKVSGVWKQASAVYNKISGVWKQSV